MMIIILSEIYYDNEDHKQYDFGKGSTSIIHSYVYVGLRLAILTMPQMHQVSQKGVLLIVKVMCATR